ncbi:hypothetical protein [Leucobacter luti]|uniref:hypothetical protein n=1 Tax=Leucobacter luti TaxID=340320 RepID=UPI003CFDDB24
MISKRKSYAIASGAALLVSLGGAALLAGPAFAENNAAQPTHAAVSPTPAGHEDGTNDGETADDQNEGTEQAGTEAADSTQPAGHEDGAHDGETADDTGAGK